MSMAWRDDCWQQFCCCKHKKMGRRRQGKRRLSSCRQETKENVFRSSNFQDDDDGITYDSLKEWNKTKNFNVKEFVC